MANQTFNSEDAVNALNNALAANEGLIDKFNNAAKTLEQAFTQSWSSVGGALGEAAANSFADSAGDMFAKDLQVKTEEFLQQRVPELLAKMDEFQNATTNAYSSTAQGNGTDNN